MLVSIFYDVMFTFTGERLGESYLFFDKVNVSRLPVAPSFTKKSWLGSTRSKARARFELLKHETSYFSFTSCAAERLLSLLLVRFSFLERAGASYFLEREMAKGR